MTPSGNYFCLAKLIIVEGTKQTRRCVLDHLPNNRPLHDVLNNNNNRRKLGQLRDKHTITEKQWQLLYPAQDNANIAKFDITLWFVLLRNVCAIRGYVNWNEEPGCGQTEWYHDIMRIRDARNSLSHLTRPELDDESFRNMWDNIVEVLRRLDRFVSVCCIICILLPRSLHKLLC